jgi:hypothetical protein
MPNTWCPRLRRRRRPLPRSRAFLMPISASNCVRPSTAQITKACAASGQPAGLNPISPLIELDQSEHPIRMAILRLESRNSRRVGSSSRGTEGSNPSPSRKESTANLTANDLLAGTVSSNDNRCARLEGELHSGAVIRQENLLGVDRHSADRRNMDRRFLIRPPRALMLALQPGFFGIKASRRGRHVQAFPRMS